jgi:hypothetical protein
MNKIIEYLFSDFFPFPEKPKRISPQLSSSAHGRMEYYRIIGKLKDLWERVLICGTRYKKTDGTQMTTARQSRNQNFLNWTRMNTDKHR